MRRTEANFVSDRVETLAGVVLELTGSTHVLDERVFKLERDGDPALVETVAKLQEQVNRLERELARVRGSFAGTGRFAYRQPRWDGKTVVKEE